MSSVFVVEMWFFQYETILDYEHYKNMTNLFVCAQSMVEVCLPKFGIRAITLLLVVVLVLFVCLFVCLFCVGFFLCFIFCWGWFVGLLFFVGGFLFLFFVVDFFFWGGCCFVILFWVFQVSQHFEHFDKAF